MRYSVRCTYPDRGGRAEIHFKIGVHRSAAEAHAFAQRTMSHLIADGWKVHAVSPTRD